MVYLVFVKPGVATQFAPARMRTLLLHGLILDHLVMTRPELRKARKIVRDPSAMESIYKLVFEVPETPLDGLPSFGESSWFAKCGLRYLNTRSVAF